MAKHVVTKPDWLKSSGVSDIYSVSSCISNEFADYINYWKHNGYWMFDNPNIIRQVAKEADVDIVHVQFFYYEAYEKQYDEETGEWGTFEPEASFPTKIKEPEKKELIGYDVISFLQQNCPECSPLSCNSLSENIKVNQHCLLSSIETAKQLLESGAFNNSEPGPFRIFAVYTF